MPNCGVYPIRMPHIVTIWLVHLPLCDFYQAQWRLLTTMAVSRVVVIQNKAVRFGEAGLNIAQTIPAF